MANKIKSATIFFYAIAVLSFFRAVCLARPNVDRSSNPHRFFPKAMPPPSLSSSDPSAGLHCAGLYSVKKGDTCYAVYTMKNITPRDFFAINPNVNCHNLFVGQWLCTVPVEGK